MIMGLFQKGKTMKHKRHKLPVQLPLSKRAGRFIKPKKGKGSKYDRNLEKRKRNEQ